MLSASSAVVWNSAFDVRRSAFASGRRLCSLCCLLLVQHTIVRDVEIVAAIRNGFSKPPIRFSVLALAVSLISALVLSSHVKKTTFHSDESGWISAGRYYTDLLWRGDFDWEKWECEACDGWGSLNMQLGKWLIGIPLELDPQVRRQNFSGYYNITASREENVQQGLVPPQETLTRARNASAFFGVVCCVLMFAIGYCAYNAFVGLLSAAMLLCNSLFVQQSSRAMTDVHYNLFLLCVSLAVIFLIRAPTRKSALTRSVVCGLFAGLACAIKVTGILIGTGMFVVALATQQIFFVKRSLKEIACSVALFGLAALIVIYGLNPYFWPSLPALSDPAAIQELKAYTSEVRDSKSLPRDVRHKYPHIGTITRVFEFPRQFRRWDNFMSWASTMRMGKWQWNRELTLNYRLFLNFMFPGQILLAAAGIFFVVGKRLPELSGLTDPARLVPLLSFVVNYLFILTFMKLNWDRYYLPTVVSTMPLAAVGTYGTGVWLYRRCFTEASKAREG